MYYCSRKKKQNQKYFHENSFLFSSLVVSVPIDRGKREAEIHKVIYYPLNINGCYRNCGLRSYKVKCLCRALTKDGYPCFPLKEKLFQKAALQNYVVECFMFIWFWKSFLLAEEFLSIQSHKASP